MKEYAVEVLDSDMDDVLWVRQSNEEEEEGSLVLAVCYLPPETSSWGMGGEKDRTGSQVVLTRPDDDVW